MCDSIINADHDHQILMLIIIPSSRLRLRLINKQTTRAKASMLCKGSWLSSKASRERLYGRPVVAATRPPAHCCVCCVRHRAARLPATRGRCSPDESASHSRPWPPPAAPSGCRRLTERQLSKVGCLEELPRVYGCGIRPAERAPRREQIVAHCDPSFVEPPQGLVREPSTAAQ